MMTALIMSSTLLSTILSRRILVIIPIISVPTIVPTIEPFPPDKRVPPITNEPKHEREVDRYRRIETEVGHLGRRGVELILQHVAGRDVAQVTDWRPERDLEDESAEVGEDSPVGGAPARVVRARCVPHRRSIAEKTARVATERAYPSLTGPGLF